MNASLHHLNLLRSSLPYLFAEMEYSSRASTANRFGSTAKVSIAQQAINHVGWVGIMDVRASMLSEKSRIENNIVKISARSVKVYIHVY